MLFFIRLVPISMPLYTRILRTQPCFPAWTRQFLRSITWLQLWEAIRFPAHPMLRSAPCLAEGCRDTLGKDRLGCLLSHHGSVAAGRNLKQAYAVALEIESLARMWMNLKQIGGCPLIDKEEMARVKEQF